MENTDPLAERRARLSPARQALLDRRLRGEASGTVEQDRILRRIGNEPAPLSFSQERLWFMDRLDGSNPAYNICQAFWLRGNLSIEALERSLNEILKRHEVLRVRFDQVDGKPVQTVMAEARLELEVKDIRLMLGGDAEAQAFQLVQEFSQQPFDLGSPPFIRAHLFCLAEKEFILAVILHHMAADGWSLNVLMQELGLLYHAFVNDLGSPLADLPIQYLDYAIWQREQDRQGKLQVELDYWREQLAGLETLQLPLDHPRAAVQNYQGRQQIINLDEAWFVEAQRFSQQEGVTLFMFLLAGFYVLLARYSGQTDLVVGTPVAGRARTDLENLIGFFTNHLALRIDISSNWSFRELLAQARQVTLAAYDHQQLPFEFLVQALKPERDLSINPLFQSLFNFHNQPLGLPKLTGLQVEPFPLEMQWAPMDLSVDWSLQKGGLSCVFLYNTQIFEDSTIENLLRHYRRLLGKALIEPDAPVMDLDILEEFERRKMLVEWNETRLDTSQFDNIVSLFESQVELAAYRNALIDQEQPLNFYELNQRANQLAHYLRKLGVRVGSPVAFYLKHSHRSAVAMLGIIKAGGYFLALDPDDPQERLSWVLSDSGAEVLLTESSYRPQLPGFSGGVVFLDEELGRLEQMEAGNLGLYLPLDAALYCVYTSGSTGRPKGVVATQRGALNRLAWMWRAYPFQVGEVCCQKTALSFVDSIWEFFGPLLQGTPIVILTPETVRDVRELVQVLEQQRVTRIVLTPSLLRAILGAHPNLDGCLSDLWFWVCSGEALPVDLYEQFRERLPGRKLLNLYGASEVAADVTYFELADLNGLAGRIPIGRPIANTQVYVLDKQLKPAPVGGTGEIMIGGASLAHGYLNQPSLTAEFFIPNPFIDLAQANPQESVSNRLYCTGDLGRYLPDGNIEYLGRVDRQVKVRGARVELGEIEAVLRHHPQVCQAVVVSRETGSGSAGIIAFYQPNTGQEIERGELNRYLRQLLPAPMIPTEIHRLDEFPLTASGKIDRRALAERKIDRALHPNPVRSARDSLEFQLVQVWEKVLEVKPVGIDDNFFDLGGHSLLAVRLFNEIERALGIDLPLATIFQAPTIEQFALLMRRQDWQPPWRSLAPIQPEGSRPPFFCVHALGGNVLGYASLAHHLGLEQPFYGLQAVGLRETDAAFHQVEAMAAHYIREIQQVQPKGPYYLGGFCFGGLVAFEMAQQLSLQGQEVAFLALIDTPPPVQPALSQVSLRHRLALHLKKYLRLDPDEREIYLRTMMKVVRRSFWKNPKGFVRGELISSERELEAIEIKRDFLIEALYKNYSQTGRAIPTGSRHLWNLNQILQRYYAPRLFRGCLTLFQNEDNRQVWLHTSLGWERLAERGVEVLGAPGDHLQLLQEPAVKVLAQELLRCMADTEKGCRK